MIQFDAQRPVVDIPLAKGVMIIDSRPSARQCDLGHIPGAINIPDTRFDKMVGKLPADKATLLIYCCGGMECALSDKSAEKTRKLDYTNVVNCPPGYPEWEKVHGASPAAAGSTATGAAVAGASPMPGKEKGTATVVSFDKVWKESPSSIMVVDVRDAKEFAGGTMKGAVNLPINDLEKKVNTLPKNKPVVFICGTGARSGEAYDMVKLLAGDVQAYFIDAEIKFGGDGTHTMVEKK